MMVLWMLLWGPVMTSFDCTSKRNRAENQGVQVSDVDSPQVTEYIQATGVVYYWLLRVCYLEERRRHASWSQRDLVSGSFIDIKHEIPGMHKYMVRTHIFFSYIPYIICTQHICINWHIYEYRMII